MTLSFGDRHILQSGEQEVEHLTKKRVLNNVTSKRKKRRTAIPPNALPGFHTFQELIYADRKCNSDLALFKELFEGNTAPGCIARAEMPRVMLRKLLTNCALSDRRADRAFDLTMEWAYAQLDKQEGMCHYCKLPMSFKITREVGRFSVERLDNRQGHLRDNCVFAWAGFQSVDNSRGRGGGAQWTIAKIIAIRELQREHVDLEVLKMKIQEARVTPTRHRKECKPAAHGQVGKCCTVCETVLPFTDFYTNGPAKHRSICKDCDQNRKTLRRQMQILLLNARVRAKKRGDICTIDADDLLDLIWEQRGRCFYSRVPMNLFDSGGSWRMSLEQLKEKHGYVRNNVALTVLEFNTPIQWSHEAIDLLCSGSGLSP
jgi:hypothetical protein